MPIASRSRIRKQVYELTPADLTRHPVWEFALDEEGRAGQDEATVRPYKVNDALDPAEGMFVVRAWLTLADGTRINGYLSPPVPRGSGLGTIQPVAVTPGGQVAFWCGIRAPKRPELSAAYARLGKPSARHVFPLRFQSDVPLAGGKVSGEVPGFIVSTLGTARTKIVK